MGDTGMDGTEAEADRIGWRKLDNGVWVGRRDDRGIGTIEHLRQYVWVDPEGRAHHGRRTLQEAQDDARCDAPPRPRRRAGPPVLVVGALWAVLVASVVLVLWQLLQP